jgi:aminoglycoside phosphotransferase (APT) family kinase protein
VLDWELSTLGEPLADFTYLLMNWFNGAIASIENLEQHGIPSVAEYTAEYCRLTDRKSLPDLHWFFAYNTFRLAGILQGIVGRVRDGTANSPQAAAMAQRVPGLAKAGWAFAQQAGATAR